MFPDRDTLVKVESGTDLRRTTSARAAGHATHPEIPRLLPHGRHRLGREIVATSQHDRLLEAMAEAVALRGYSATTVADVVERAGVSRKTFYEHFGDKLGCFLATYDAAAELLLAAMAEAGGRGTDWRARMDASVRAYLAGLSEHGFARASFLDVPAAGDDALARRAEVHERFAVLLRRIHTAARRSDPTIPYRRPMMFRAAVGAVNELVTEAVRTRDVTHLPRLAPVVVEILDTLLGAPTS